MANASTWRVWSLSRRDWFNARRYATRREAERAITELTRGKRDLQTNVLRRSLTALREGDTMGRAACQREWDAIGGV